jgi:hypothetical protein
MTERKKVDLKISAVLGILEGNSRMGANPEPCGGKLAD